MVDLEGVQIVVYRGTTPQEYVPQTISSWGKNSKWNIFLTFGIGMKWG